MPRPILESPNYHLVKIKGRRKWYVRWTERGRTQTASTGEEERRGAEQWLAEFIASAAEPREKVSDLIDAYLAARQDRLTIETMKYLGKTLKKHFGNLRPSQIVVMVPAYHKKRKHKMTAIRRELELLRSVLLFAAEQEWIEKAPKIPLPAKRPPRDVYLTRPEGEALIEGARKEHVRLFLWIGLRTGQRRNAILGLTWDRVNFERSIIDFRDPERQETKKRRGVVPIDVNLMDALREARKDSRSKYVIEWGGKPVSDIRNGIDTARENAGIAWVTPHVMKHSVISWFAEDGYTVDQIADFTSTDPETVRRIYRKVNPESLRGMADSLANSGVIANGVHKNGK